MLSKDVRVAVASYDLKTQWDAALDGADDVYNALKPFLEVKGTEVAAISLDETAPDEPELQHDVTDVSVGAKDRQTWDCDNRPKSK